MAKAAAVYFTFMAVMLGAYVAALNYSSFIFMVMTGCFCGIGMGQVVALFADITLEKLKKKD